MGFIFCFVMLIKLISQKNKGAKVEIKPYPTPDINHLITYWC